MPETPESADELKKIRFRIESIESTQGIILRHNASEYRQEILRLFEGDDELRRVYLAVDGKRTQAQIVAYLNEVGPSISQPTVSRRMAKLEDEGLISKLDATPSGVIWARKDVMERVLRLSRHLGNG